MPRREADRATRDASLKAAINALPGVRGGDNPDTIQASTDFRTGSYTLVIEAARLRKMSVGGYLRRAAFAMACHDLGLPLSEALSRDPRATRENGFAAQDPEGTIFGLWEIERLIGEVDDEPTDGQ
jgi:hypothetical protein